MIKIKVIKLTNASGKLAWPAPGNALNTSLGLGQKLCENRIVPYAIRKAPNVNASLIKKYHIISFPYSTLKGLLPPFHQFVLVAVAVAIIKFIVYSYMVCSCFRLYKPLPSQSVRLIYIFKVALISSKLCSLVHSTTNSKPQTLNPSYPIQIKNTNK
jgi:hypothetical protein